jgi:2-methylene-furan-3-one reductase
LLVVFYNTCAAEYHLVEEQYVELKPPQLSFIEGAAIANSPVNGMLALEDAQLTAGERLLVLGGSGACGGSIIQIAKAKGASFIAATSTAVDLVTSLGADKVMDYTCGGSPASTCSNGTATKLLSELLATPC